MPSFEQIYPHVICWIKRNGWIEVGNDGINRSWVRALDEGGLIQEGSDPSQLLDETLRPSHRSIPRGRLLVWCPSMQTS
jgi:hypothetical protein